MKEEKLKTLKIKKPLLKDKLKCNLKIEKVKN